MQGIAIVVATLLAGSVWAQPAKVRFGLPVQALDGLALFVAEDRGFFAEEGLAPEFTVLKGGTGVVQALVSGDIDIGMVGPVEVSVLRSKGVDVKMIGTSLDWPVFSILVHKQLNITNVAGLKGRSIGVTSPASLTDAMARYFLTRAGLQPGKDVTILSLGGGPEMVGAFKSRKVDALILFEPFVQLLLAEGNATMILDVPKEIPGYPSFGVVAKGSLLKSNLPLARKSMAAIAKGLRFIKSDEKAARAIAQKKFPAMKPEVLNAALDHYLPYFSKDGVISPQVIQFTQELNRSAGLTQTIYPYSEMYFNVR
jgi:NitT/TauT family transport system substrate-binding protein